MKWKRLPYLLVLPFFFYACKGPQETRLADDIVERDGKIYYSGPRGEEVVFHILSDPGNLHPINSRFAYRDYIMGYMYQKLMSVDIDTGEQIPDLAAKKPTVSADGLTYTFDLHPEAAWDDGEPILATDILFSYKVVCTPFVDNQNLKPYLEYIESITLDENDPRRFQVKMKTFFISNDNFGFMATILDSRVWDKDQVLAGFSLPDLLNATPEVENSQILKDWAEDFNDPKWGRELDLLNSGAGPYKMAAWEEGAFIELVRNENFWAKNIDDPLLAQKPNPLLFKILREEQAIALQIKQEEIDFSLLLSPELFQDLLDDPAVTQKYYLEMRKRASLVCLMLNNQPDGVLQKPIFSDQKTRRALAYATPLDQAISDLLSVNARRTQTPIAPGNVHYYGDIPPIPYDPAQAESLLDEAGWTEKDEEGIRFKTVSGEVIPLRFSLMYPPNGELMKNMLTRFKESWKQVGIDCELVTMGMADYVPMVRAREFDAALFGFAIPDFPYDFKQLFHSESYPEGDNLAGFSNPKADSLMEALRIEPDLALRQKMAQEVQEMLYDAQPILFLYNPTRKIALHKRFNNAEIYDIPSYVEVNNLEVLVEEVE